MFWTRTNNSVCYSLDDLNLAGRGRPHMKNAIRALALAAIAAWPAIFATAAGAADKVRFQTDWLPSGEHAMYYGGWQKGIFAEEGIDVTITRGYGSGDTLTKLAGGAFDFGVADVASVLTARVATTIAVGFAHGILAVALVSSFFLCALGMVALTVRLGN